MLLIRFIQQVVLLWGRLDEIYDYSLSPNKTYENEKNEN